MGQKLNIKPLKELVFKEFPPDSVLRDLILSEDDELTAEEFIVKTRTWLKLVNREFADDKAQRADNITR